MCPAVISAPPEPLTQPILAPVTFPTRAPSWPTKARRSSHSAQSQAPSCSSRQLLFASRQAPHTLHRRYRFPLAARTGVWARLARILGQRLAAGPWGKKGKQSDLSAPIVAVGSNGRTHIVGIWVEFLLIRGV